MKSVNILVAFVLILFYVQESDEKVSFIQIFDKNRCLRKYSIAFKVRSYRVMRFKLTNMSVNFKKLCFFSSRLLTLNFFCEYNIQGVTN
jgi:hypothetical protein